MTQRELYGITPCTSIYYQLVSLQMDSFFLNTSHQRQISMQAFFSHMTKSPAIRNFASCQQSCCKDQKVSCLQGDRGTRFPVTALEFDAVGRREAALFGVDILLKRSGESWQRNEACARACQQMFLDKALVLRNRCPKQQ